MTNELRHLTQSTNIETRTQSHWLLALYVKILHTTT
jgi:hypothetical protein